MWREPEDRQWHQREPGSYRRRQRRAHAWYRIDADTRFNARPDQLRSRIGDPWRPGVGDQRNRIAPLKAADQLRKPGSRVVLVKTDGWRRDGVAREKPGRTPRVLGGNDLHLAQDAQRAQRDVLQIANWRCDDEESARHVGSDARAGVCLERVVIVPSGDARSRTDDNRAQL